MPSVFSFHTVASAALALPFTSRELLSPSSARVSTGTVRVWASPASACTLGTISKLTYRSARWSFTSAWAPWLLVTRKDTVSPFVPRYWLLTTG